MSNLSIVEHKGFRVVTTKQLAQVYETTADNINVSYLRNKRRFVEGRDYYKLEGAELKEFKRVANGNYQPNNHTKRMVVESRAKIVYLWTERGANRHCKILDTDRAWQQFDRLEETYFRAREAVVRQPPLPLPKANEPIDEARQLNAQARFMNAKRKSAEFLLQKAEELNLSPVAKEALKISALELVTGRGTLPHPQIAQHYTATKIALELKTNKMVIGKLATAHKLKTEEYGMMVLGQSQHSAKQVQTFLYNEKGKAKITEIFNKQKSHKK